MTLSKALIIDSPHIERILSGAKIWEMRSTKTTQRGRVALIRKGSGLVVGTVEIVGCSERLNRQAMIDARSKHLIDLDRINSGDVDKWCYGWVLRDARALAKPVPYVHPPGAVIWVRLDPAVVAAIEARDRLETAHE